MEDWKLEPARDHGLSTAERARSLKRESGIVEDALLFAWAAFTRVYLRAFHRLRIRGSERIPAQPPFVLVANHGSHLDTLALSAALPWRLQGRVFPLAAGDVFFDATSRAVFAALLVNALPMSRKRPKAGDLAELRRRMVDEPCGFILFPEGTRTRTGTVGAFKAGIGALVAGTPVPVIPCSLDGAFRAWPPHRRLPLPRRITLTVGAPLSFAHAPNDRDGWTLVASETEAAVRKLVAEGGARGG